MNNFASIRKMGCGYSRIAAATFMLPVLLVLALINKALEALNIRTSFLGNFIRKFYPELKLITFKRFKRLKRLEPFSIKKCQPDKNPA